MKSLAFGCNHTYGVGVEKHETWPYLLGADNFGVNGCSADYITRTAPSIIEVTIPDIIFVLWPDWTRFEYLENNEYKQSLPSNSNRIKFMQTANDDWLKNNFSKQVNIFKNLCNNKKIKLVDMTLYDLIPYMDHADKWPLSKLGHHYAPIWHEQVAKIFEIALVNNITHPLNNE